MLGGETGNSIFGVEEGSHSILDQVDAYLQDNNDEPSGSTRTVTSAASVSNAHNNDDNDNDNEIANNNIQQNWNPMYLDDMFTSMLDHHVLDRASSTATESGISHSDLNLLSTREGHSKTELNMSSVPNEFIFSPVIDSNNKKNGKLENSNESPFIVPFMPSFGVISGNESNITNTPYLRGNTEKKKRNSSGSGGTGTNSHAAASFSPLTSPAITPITAKKVVKNSPRISLVNRTYAETKREKRSKSGSVSVQRTQTSLNNNGQEIWDEFLFKLPASSMNTGEEKEEENNKINSYPKVILPSHSSSSLKEEGKDKLNNINEHYDGEDMSKNSMNIDDNRELGEIESKTVNTKFIRATESPVIKPRLSSQLSWKKKQLSHAQVESMVKDIQPYQYEYDSNSLTSSNELMKTISNAAENESTTISKIPSSSSIDSKSKKKERTTEEELVKKNVHKAAEQGRRNRLNTALNELKQLIPDELKQTVEVPSKATTVELACHYIKQLLQQQQQK